MINLKKMTVATVGRSLSCVCLAVALSATVPLSVEAGNGKNGNNGNNGNNNRNANSDEPRNARGMEARNLRSLNAARANENAFLNASPNSNVGQIAAYRDAIVDGNELIAKQNVAARDLLYLQDLTQEEIDGQFPDGDYEDVLARATDDYLKATEDAQDANDARLTLLNQLTDGRTLSDSDLAAFHAMLGF